MHFKAFTLIPPANSQVVGGGLLPSHCSAQRKRPARKQEGAPSDLATAQGGPLLPCFPPDLPPSGCLKSPKTGYPRAYAGLSTTVAIQEVKQLWNVAFVFLYFYTGCSFANACT